MGEKKFTIIELHLDGDAQFGPRAIDDALPFGEKRESDELAEGMAEESDDEAAAAAEDDSGGRGAVGALIALAVLAAIGVAVKKYTGDEDEDELPEQEQPDVIVN
ncbi:hypothetical protein [Natronococcus wangiae]|uniref:hypothetical protein n=1 Tax=Natronococcus wangiae TaxID=3068275 RepID=UPI00273DFEDE|nr:hypothetical protein [Natronococcus sp. AD5]